MGPNYVPTFKFFLGLKKFQGGQLFFKGWANIKILNYYIFKKKIPRSGWSFDHPALNVALPLGVKGKPSCTGIGFST